MQSQSKRRTDNSLSIAAQVNRRAAFARRGRYGSGCSGRRASAEGTRAACMRFYICFVAHRLGATRACGGAKRMRDAWTHGNRLALRGTGHLTAGGCDSRGGGFAAAPLSSRTGCCQAYVLFHSAAANGCGGASLDSLNPGGQAGGYSGGGLRRTKRAGRMQYGISNHPPNLENEGSGRESQVATTAQQQRQRQQHTSTGSSGDLLPLLAPPHGLLRSAPLLVQPLFLPLSNGSTLFKQHRRRAFFFTIVSLAA
ncbi:hypothetical protein BX070DRAFT_17867 [Coemansia spiralis]|nr:hypothetical protein BX070DRAFT_17867 [Coemansia spiralis]